MPDAHRLFACHRMKRFTAGQSGTSAAEAGNASFKAQLLTTQMSLPVLFAESLMHDSRHYQDECDLAATACVVRPAGAPYDLQHRVALEFSGHAVALFMEQQRRAPNYTVEPLEDGSFEVTPRADVPFVPQLLSDEVPEGPRNRAIPAHPARVVHMPVHESEVVRCTCLHTTAFGVPCRHMLAVASTRSQSQFLHGSFHAHWKLQKHVPKHPSWEGQEEDAVAAPPDDGDEQVIAHDAQTARSLSQPSQPLHRNKKQRYNALLRDGQGLFALLQESPERAEAFLAVMQAATCLARREQEDPLFGAAARHFYRLFQDDHAAAAAAADGFLDESVVADPASQKRPGRYGQLRLTNSVEQQTKTGRKTCNFCGGQGHTTPTCPVCDGMGETLTSDTWDSLLDAKVP